MAYFSDMNSGVGFYNKPRYRHQVLLGNWFEDRAQRDPAFLPQPQYQKKTPTEEVIKQDRASNQSHVSADQSLTNHAPPPPRALSDKLKEQSEESERVSPGEVLKGYYNTSYKRAYEPHHLHMASYPATCPQPLASSDLQQGSWETHQAEKPSGQRKAYTRDLHIAGL